MIFMTSSARAGRGKGKRVSSVASAPQRRPNRKQRTLELGEEDVDDLVLLDGEREEVDLLDRLDLAVLDEATKLGDGDPEERRA
jgi:hypothetical protein